MTGAEGQSGVVEPLSQALVALTIEVDDEFEQRMTHRTTTGGSAGGDRGGPWLVSSVMWFNCMRFVSDCGVTVAEGRTSSTHVDESRRHAPLGLRLDRVGIRAPAAVGRLGLETDSWRS